MFTGIYAFYAKSAHKRKITSDINHFMNTSCIKDLNMVACQYKGHNLKEGLKCLNYSGSISSKQSFGDNSLQEVHWHLLEFKVLKVNEENQYMNWFGKSQFAWHDQRLKWPDQCENGQPSQNSQEIVKSEMLDLLWNPVALILDAVANAKLSFDKTISISKVCLLYTSDAADDLL